MSDIFEQKLSDFCHLNKKASYSSWYGVTLSRFIQVLSLCYLGLKVNELVMREGDRINSFVGMHDADKIPPVRFNETDYIPTYRILDSTK